MNYYLKLCALLIAVLGFSSATMAQCNLSAGIVDSTCNGGAIYAFQSGGTSPYTYLWNDGSTSNTIFNPTNNTFYSVTVTDAVGCTDTAFTYIDSSQCAANCNLAIAIADSACDYGQISAWALNGQGPYTYQWSNGANTATLTGVSHGSFSVTVTDANGCLASNSIFLDSTQCLPNCNMTVFIVDSTCINGIIDAIAWNSAPPYSYLWSNGATTSQLNGISHGSYSVTVTGSNGCSQSDNIFVDSTQCNPACGQISAYIYGDSLYCPDSVLYASGWGGTAPYNYLWSDGSTGNTLFGPTPGSYYTVTVTDANGCSDIDGFYVDSTCYNSIAGYVYNQNTCSGISGIPVPNMMVTLQPLGISTFTNSNGYYYFNVPMGNYTITFGSNGNLYNVLCPTGGSLSVNNSSSSWNNNFYVNSPNPIDLMIDIGRYTTATPGFPLWATVQYCNVGNTTQSGTVEYTYDAQINFDQVHSYWGQNTASLASHNTANNLLTFNYSNLQPGECGTIRINFDVPTTVPLGNVVSNTGTIYPLNGDATPSNNTDVDNATVVGSWDPNEKLVDPIRTGNDRDGGIIYEQDEQLNYTIHFQNLGTAPAYRVVIRDELDANLKVETIRNIQMSHNGVLTIENGNELVFTFENINLPHASADYEGSNGYVKFTIDRTAGLPLGTTIDNDAGIYFDFNAPVITNNAQVEIGRPASVSVSNLSSLESRIYPNPTTGQLTLEYELGINAEVSIQLYNTLGAQLRNLQTATNTVAGQHSQQFSLADLPAGVYYLAVETENGRSLHKVVKQ